jgi:nucleoside-diphosphate-sugar epimerase
MKVLIIGASGFVGVNLIKYFKNSLLEIETLSLRDLDFNNNFECNTIINLSGIAHDVKNVNNSQIYYDVNTKLAQNIFEKFLNSNVQIFITLSSVKAVADKVDEVLTEEDIPNPITDYGKSKLLAEQYILSKEIPNGKRVYILRPCMIHGPKNKGNLNLLYNIVSKGFPWPLGSFENKRSFCSIDNLCFIIKELIENDSILSGVYNVADDEPLSTNELIRLIAYSLGKQTRILNLPKFIIKCLAKIGDLIELPLNTERLNKLTESYIVSNVNIKKANKLEILFYC